MTPLGDKLQYVNQVIKALEMQSYADAVIGTRGDGQCSETLANFWMGTDN